LLNNEHFIHNYNLGAAAAVSFSNLIHCALSLAVAMVGLAMLYLHLGAEFVGFTQVLVYVGAVSIVVLFAILLTRPAPFSPGVHVPWHGRVTGILVAGLVAGMLVGAVLGTPLTSHVGQRVITVKQIGMELMTTYAAPLEIVGLLLTAALMGAVILAAPENGEKKP